MTRKNNQSGDMQEVEIVTGTDEIAKMQGHSDEYIIKSFILKSEKDEPSKQILYEETWDQLYTSGEILRPLYDPLIWASLMEKDARLAKLIRTYARNTVGLGWGIYPKNPITKRTKKAEKDQIEKEKESLSEFFENCNPDLPFNEIMFNVKVDEEATGNGYLEVARNASGRIMNLYHIPSHTMRIRKDLKGFVQIRDGKKVYFKKFGLEEDMNAKNGQIGSVPFTDRANEIIHFKIYTPRDSYYGAPRYVANADGIAGNKFAARRNLAFFKNDATPRMAVVVQNGQLTGQSIDEIKSFINVEGKGPENSGRAMVLQAKQKNQPGVQQKDVKIEVIPLTVGVTDDASHIKYTSANDEKLREVFGIAEVFLGAKGSVNRATAMVSRAITNEQEFIPDAKTKEYKLNQSICKEFGVQFVKLEFERANAIDELGQAEVFSRYLQGGGITPNDIRHELGKDEYTEEWADKPIQIALVEYQMGLLAAKGAVSQGGKVDENGKNGKEEGGKKEENGKKNEEDTEDSKKSNIMEAYNITGTEDEKIKMISDIVAEMINKSLPEVLIKV